MRFLFWRVERVSSHANQTRIRIEIQRNPEVYFYKWVVDDPRSMRLNKRELHELDMRVAKYVATLNEDAPSKPGRQTDFAVL